MKRKIITLGLAAILVLSLMTGCGGNTTTSSSSGTPTPEPAAPEKVIVLKLANQWPSTNFMNQEGGFIEQWTKELEEYTGGLVTIENYPDNTLISARENYQGIVDGIADIGMVPYSYSTGRFPVVEAFLLPGVANFNNAIAGSHAVNEAIETLNPAELQDTHHLYSFSTGASALLSTKKPIRTLEDVKGLSFGVTQAERAKAMELWGAVPVSVPAPEFYEGCQRGLMDGGIMSLESLRSLRLIEVTGDYITMSPVFACSMNYCVMNKDTWDSLPDIAKEFFSIPPEYILGGWDTQGLSVLNWAREQKDVELIYLEPEEEARWAAAISSIGADNIKALDAQGIDGAELHKYIKELQDKYNEMFPMVLRDSVE